MTHWLTIQTDELILMIYCVCCLH